MLDQEKDFSITHHTCFSWFSRSFGLAELISKASNMGITDAWSQKHEAAQCPITVSRPKTWLMPFSVVQSNETLHVTEISFVVQII